MHHQHGFGKDVGKNLERTDLERMLICVLHHPTDAEPHNISPGELKGEGLFYGIRCLGGRVLHNSKSHAQILWTIRFVFVSDVMACKLASTHALPPKTRKCQHCSKMPNPY